MTDNPFLTPDDTQRRAPWDADEASLPSISVMFEAEEALDTDTGRAPIESVSALDDGWELDADDVEIDTDAELVDADAELDDADAELDDAVTVLDTAAVVPTERPRPPSLSDAVELTGSAVVAYDDVAEISGEHDTTPGRDPHEPEPEELDSAVLTPDDVEPAAVTTEPAEDEPFRHDGIFDAVTAEDRQEDDSTVRRVSSVPPPPRFEVAPATPRQLSARPLPPLPPLPKLPVPARAERVTPPRPQLPSRPPLFELDRDGITLPRNPRPRPSLASLPPEPALVPPPRSPLPRLSPLPPRGAIPSTLPPLRPPPVPHFDDSPRRAAAQRPSDRPSAPPKAQRRYAEPETPIVSVSPAQFAYRDEDQIRTSLMPITRSASVSPLAELGKLPLARFAPVAVGAIVGVALFLVTVLFTQAKSRQAATALDNALVVTVAGPGDAPVTEANIFVDGARRCEASPCRVLDLGAGMHFVSVAAPGYDATSPRVVQLKDGEPSALHFQLVPDSSVATFSDVEDVTSVVSAPPPAPAVAPAPIVTAPPSPPKAPSVPVAPVTAFGQLNLNSIPVANVVVDGRPLGSTPKVGVRVKAGTRQVVFVHPEHGRLARSVTVAPGSARTVAVRF